MCGSRRTLSHLSGGSYYPPEPREGLPGFRPLLLQIAETVEEE